MYKYFVSIYRVPVCSTIFMGFATDSEKMLLLMLHALCRRLKEAAEHRPAAHTRTKHAFKSIGRFSVQDRTHVDNAVIENLKHIF